MPPHCATGARAVVRQVRTGSRDGVPTRTTVASRIFSVEQNDLWEALTNLERLPRWFGSVRGDLRPGGHYEIEGNASGRIECCEVPDCFFLTWEFGDQVSWVAVHLVARSDGTELSISHESAVEDPEFWAEYGPGAGGVGWDLGLLSLDRYLASDPEFDPTAAEEFATSSDGRTFITASAWGWAEAGIADGDDAAGAREAAERTIAFYTAAPSEP